MSRPIRRTLLVAAAACALVAGAVWVVVGTEAGARFVVTRAAPDEVEVEGVEGRLLGPLRIGRVTWAARAGGTHLRVDSVAFEWSPSELLAGTLAVRSLSVGRVTASSEVKLLEGLWEIPRPEPALRGLERLLGRPIRPPLPLALRVDRLDVGGVRLRSPDVPEPVVVDRIRARGRAGSDGVVLEELSVSGPGLDLDAGGRFRPGPVGEGTVRVRADVRGRIPGRPPVSARFGVEGTTEHVQIRLTTSEPLASRLEGRIRDIGGEAEWAADWSADSIPVADWSPTAPLRELSASVRAEGSLRRDPYGEIILRAVPTSGPSLRGRIGARLSGDSVILEEVRVESPDAPSALEARGTLAVAGGSPSVRLDGEWRALRWPLDGQPAAVSDSGRFRLRGTRDSVNVEVVAAASTPQTGRLRAELAALVSPDSAVVRRLTLRPAGTSALLRASGVVGTAGPAAAVRADVEWSGLTWPLRGDTPVVRSPSGELVLSGTRDRLAYRLAARARVDDRSARVSAEGTARPDRIELATGRLTLPEGTVAASGRVALPDGAWLATMSADSLALEAVAAMAGKSPPDALREAWASLRVTASGTRDRRGIRGTARLDSLRGRILGEPLAGGARASFSADGLALDSLDVEVGATHASATGRIGDRIELDGEVRMPTLAPVHPDATGSAVARVSARGERSDPTVELSLRADSVTYGPGGDTVRVGAIDASARWRPRGDGLPAGTLVARGVRARGARVDSLFLGSERLPSGTGLRFGADAAAGRLRVAAEVEPARGGWAGRVDSLTVDVPAAGSWRLRVPAALDAEPDSAALAPLCLERERSSLCVDGSWRRSDGVRWSLSADSLPLALFDPWMPDRLSVGGGDLRLAARGTVDTAGRVTADLRAGGDALLLRAVSASDTVARAIDSVRVEGRIAPDSAAGSLALGLADGGHLSVRAGADRAGDEWGRVDGLLSVDLRDDGLAGSVVPSLSSTAGSVVGRLRVEGVWPRPAVRGTLSLEGGSADVVPHGLALRDVRLSASDAGPGAVRLVGGVRSGPGSVRLDGTASLAPGDSTLLSVDLRIAGEDLEVQNTAALRVLVSPDLRVAGDARGLAVTGRVRVPEARISPRRLEAPVVASPDVVVAGRQSVSADTAASLFPAPPVQTDVEILLGDRVSVEAFGLRGRLAGDLRVSARPNRPPTGRGEIQIVQGRYLAFQRSLRIDQGRLLFAGGPLEDPGLDLRITRRTSGVEVGMTVGGTASDPRFTLFSIPALSETDLLSYLLFGRPVAAVSRIDGTVLRDAVQGVGLVSGDALAARLGTALGLEESRLVTDDGRATSLVLGTHLSPRLTLGYSLGLFGTPNTLRIGYRIGRGWVVRAESGAGGGADVMYIIER